MTHKSLLFSCIFILLTACTPITYKKPPVNAPSDDAAIKLAEAATSISDSMLEVAQVEKVVTPPPMDNILTIPNAYNLQARATVDWSGPIEELTLRIANAAHYKLRTIGRAPAIPVLISVTIKDESLAEILRNIDYQARKRAYIHVYPNAQVVELRYA